MARLPDRFDLWVRKAQQSADPERQADWILGALVARENLYFLNVGTKEKPRIAKAAVAADECALVFTDPGRIETFIAGHPAARQDGSNGPPVIASPTAAALKWCMENRSGLAINPGEGATALVPAAVLAAFVEDWRARSERQGAGFWIPNMSSEEEDFWQEHGL
jgi:hypothetical protein